MQGNKLINTHGRLIENIFKAHAELAELNRQTPKCKFHRDFGIEWELKDGVVLYPRNTITDYLSGLFAILWPEAPLIVVDNYSPPQEWEQISQKLPNALVVLCRMQSYLDYDLGLDYGRLMAKLPVNLLGRAITARQLGELLPAGDKTTKFYDYFRKTDFPAEPSNHKKILKAFELFQESLSIGTYLQILKRYLLKADTPVPTVKTPMYFEDIFKLSPNEVIIDCGGFTGDTLQFYLDNINHDFGAYYLFEPDPDNFAQLEKNLETLPLHIKNKTTAFQKAVGHTPGELEFTGQGSLESRVDIHNGIIKVESVPLDLALKDIRPGFIKMDLEGYEAFALLGARNIIKERRPILAICVYHYPFDLWELPLLVNSFVKGYRYYLRAYNEMFDYVCYCVPEERLACNNK